MKFTQEQVKGMVDDISHLISVYLNDKFPDHTGADVVLSSHSDLNSNLQTLLYDWGAENLPYSRQEMLKELEIRFKDMGAQDLRVATMTYLRELDEDALKEVFENHF